MGSSHFSVRMKTLLLLLPTLSALAGTPGEDRQEAPELPQFLQQLPFFSQIQSLQEAFQHLQATIPPEIMTQLQQSLPPFLASFLLQPTGRAEVIKAEELTEKQENDISEFIRRCNGLFSYNNGVAGTYNSYPNTGNSGYYGYNTGYNY